MNWARNVSFPLDKKPSDQYLILTIKFLKTGKCKTIDICKGFDRMLFLKIMLKWLCTPDNGCD